MEIWKSSDRDLNWVGAKREMIVSKEEYMAIFASVTDYVKNGLPADNWMRESGNIDYPKKAFLDWDDFEKKHTFDEIKDKSVRESARWIDGLIQIWDFSCVSVYFPNPHPTNQSACI